jgi:N6-adenosine-specific RNA methylase IME4
VMAAWGFKYKSNAVWEKNCAGNGYWFRGRHELLLVGTRGKIPAPAPGDNWDSVIKVRKGRFAEKPDIVYELIEAYFPNLPKIELNARKARAGWDAWGNEAPQVEGNEVAPPQVDNVVPLRPKERRALTFGTKVDVWVA